MHLPFRTALHEGEHAAARYALAVPRAAPSGTAGSTLSSRAGSSLELKDHRAYEPGDDLRHIDWFAYARSDQLTVKLYREEVMPRLDLVVDASRSMDLEGTAKGAATVALAAFFAAAARRADYTHAGWLMGAGCAPLPNGGAAPGEWGEWSFDHRGEPAGPMPPWRPGGTRILISDLLWPLSPLSIVRPLAERASVAVVVQLLARADAAPPEGQALRLIDSETGEVKEVHVEADVARRYREGLARHQENWRQACQAAGATFLTVLAEDLLRKWDLTPLVLAGALRVA